MNRRGFTIVELIIVIAIMGILLVLTAVNLRSSQANARDEERKTDIESISLNLESFYRNGNSSSTDVGRYPSTGIVGQETTILENIDIKVLAAPGTTVSALQSATVNTQSAASIVPTPGSNNDIYVYQPMKLVSGVWTRCTSEADDCRKYNLYYWREIDNTVVMVTSKNQ